nr:hypothetical protein TetV2_00560 [Oceanusvirus sp.]
MTRPADALEGMVSSLSVLFRQAADKRSKKKRVGRFSVTDDHNPEFCAELRKFIDAYDLMSTALADALEADGETAQDRERRNAAMMRASRMMPNALHDVRDKEIIGFIRKGTKLFEKTAMELLLVEKRSLKQRRSDAHRAAA